MFAIPGFVTLVFFVYARPQEVFEPLKNIPALNLLFLITAFGWLLDVRLGITKLRPSPLLFWGVAFWAWAFLTLLVRAPGNFTKLATIHSVSFFLFITASQAIQSFRSLRAVASAVLISTILLCWVGIAQNYGPLVCARELPGAAGRLQVDGRSCQTSQDCYQGAADESAEWQCEHQGPLETTSIAGGRVRYRGILEDPNELALVLAISLPFAFARRAQNPNPLSTAGATAAFVAIAVCIVFTQSRGGQLGFLAVLGLYLLRRLKWAGVVMAALAALPVLLLGGRSNSEASESTMERLQAMNAGLKMWMSSPIIGVGMGQYSEHHYLTAHNSYVLALGELGIPGVFLWTAMCWFALRLALVVVRRSSTPESRIGQIWGVGVLAALSGLLVSAAFLSFAYHPVFWLHMGLASGLVMATQRHDEELQIPVRFVDVLGIVAIDVVVGVGLSLYIRLKGVS